MATLGLLASWAAALFGGWAFVGGLATVAPGHPVRRSSERALLAAALAALTATGALVALLLAGDVTISYVARSLTRNLPRAYRYAALWNLPAGAVLPTAALVAVAGWAACRSARASLGVAATGAIVMALCAASLAATPFATLPWVPGDGVGLAPGLQHPLSVVGRAALSLTVASAAAVVALAADRLADAGPATDDRSRLLLLATAALLAVTLWAASAGGYATGVDPAPAALAAWRGALVPAVAALAVAYAARRATAIAAFATALGALGLVAAVLLGAVRAGGSGWVASLFPILSLGAATVGGVVAAGAHTSASGRALHGAAVLLLAAGAASALWLPAAPGDWLAPGTQWLVAAGGVTMAVATGFAGGSHHGSWSPSDSAGPGVAAGASTFRLARAAPLILGAVGAGLASLLAPGLAPSVGWGALAGASLGAALSVDRSGRAAGARVPGLIVAVAVALAAIGAAGESAARATSTTVAGGASTTVAMRFGAPLTVLHQGISRFQDGNAHVQAIALELMRGQRPLGLLSADRREFVDARDEILGAVTLRPAVAALPLESVRIRADDIAPDERAMLRLTVVPFARAWFVAVLGFTAAALLSLVLRGERPSPPDSARHAVA